MLDVFKGRVREIFVGCLRCDTRQEIEQLIQRECAGDIAMESAVNELLGAHDGNSRFLERPLDILLDGRKSDALAATHALPSTAEAELPTIGPYKLMEQIGEGGMGIVFVAKQQHPIRRTVALKLIKPGMDSKQVVARFEAERQALAVMNHPNIAKVLEAGMTDAGAPYFVMELVRGVPITDYCARHQLDLRERLGLFVKVCEAIQHAHQKGVIHRDIKPSNILVELADTRAVPKVIDFGIAKSIHQPLTESTAYTGFNQLVGTPLYMSPEQAQLNSLDIDTRSDVYSLGVVLYELITGTTPFDLATLKRVGFDEMRRMIREDEPPRPSGRLSTLKGQATTAQVEHRRDRRPINIAAVRSELDWIVLRAMEKDRTRRYGSTLELADDIERFLQHEPVKACPPSNWYRVTKLVKRHKTAATAAAMVIMSLSVGTGLATWQAVRATRAEQRAEQRSALARQAVDDMYTKVAMNWLNDKGALTDVQREFLEKALAYYSDFKSDYGQDPESTFKALIARERVAFIAYKLGNLANAEADYRELLSECKQTLQRLDYPEIRLLAVNSQLRLAAILRVSGKELEATELSLDACSQLQHIDTTLPHKLKLEFGLVELDRNLANSLDTLARQLVESGKHAEAEEAVGKCIQIWEGLVIANPASWDLRLGLARARSLRGMERMWWGGHNGEAEASYSLAVSELTVLIKEKPRDRAARAVMHGALNNLGVICSWENRNAECASIHRRALAVAQELVNDYPNDHRLKSDLLSSLENLAVSISEHSDADSSELLSLIQRENSVLKELVNTSPESIDYRLRFARTIWSRFPLVIKLGREDLADQWLSEATAMIDAWTKDETARSEPLPWSRMQDAVGHFACELLLLSVARLIDASEYTEATRILGSIPPSKTAFDHARVLLHREFWCGVSDKVDAQTKLLDECKDDFRKLLIASLQYQELARTVENQGGESQQLPHIQRLRARAAELKQEATVALDVWVSHLFEPLQQDAETGVIVLKECDLLVKELEEDRTQLSRFLNNAERQSRCMMVQMLLTTAAAKLPRDKDMHRLVGYLTAGPQEMRDAELALQFAQTACQAFPDDHLAKQNLGWALFRAQRWIEALELLLPDDENQRQTQSGGVNGSVIAMCFWNLGKRNEAAAWVTHSRAAIDDYIYNRTKAMAEEEPVFPTASMVSTLLSEAQQLVRPDAE